jgi:hypothetical protein
MLVWRFTDINGSTFFERRDEHMEWANGKYSNPSRFVRDI